MTILDGLIQNAGSRFQRTFVDEPLLERLRVLATDPVSDPQVKLKCKTLFGQWAASYRDTPGLARISTLYKQLPQRKKPPPQQQQQTKVLKETEAEVNSGTGGSSFAASSTPIASSSSLEPVPDHSRSDNTKSSFFSQSKGKKDKSLGKPFNLEKEKPQLLQALASSSIASTNLMNALKLVNRESKRVSEDAEVMKQFETCKTLRRQILRYIQNVESEQWLGGLIHANEELVNALMAFEVLDKSVEDDSDSEEDDWGADKNPTDSWERQKQNENVARSFAGLQLAEDGAPAKPPRPGMNMPLSRPPHGKGKARATVAEDDEVNAAEEDDADDPFADSNAITE